MRESSNPIVSLPAVGAQDVLTSILRDGAQRLLTQAIEAEVAEWIAAHRHLQDASGHRQVVRNGRLPERTLVTGVGPVKVKQPRVLSSPRSRRSGALLLEDSAALPAEDEEHRGADSLAVSERHQHGRLQ